MIQTSGLNRRVLNNLEGRVEICLGGNWGTFVFVMTSGTLPMQRLCVQVPRLVVCHSLVSVVVQSYWIMSSVLAMNYNWSTVLTIPTTTASTLRTLE